MNFEISMPPELYNALNQHYNVLGTIEFKHFDCNWEVLEKFFKSTRKDEFDPLDRYIIQHQDTDVYINECSVGLNLRNFINMAIHLDIPVYTLIIWTNHFGLQKEIDILCKDQHINNRPTIIESFCALAHIADHDRYKDYEIAADQIKIHALSMMGANRSHRFALYNALKHIGSDKIAMSIKGLRS
jgi:hypothetical protein